MEIIARVRKGYMLQLGPDQGNWVPGGKTIRINDPELVKGQRYKLEILKGEIPTKATAAPPPPRRAQAPQFVKGEIEIVDNGPGVDRLGLDSREMEEHRAATAAVPTPAQILEQQNETIQAASKNRAAEIAALGGSRRRQTSAVEILDEEEAAPGPTMTAEEILSTARPITKVTTGAVEVLEDDPVSDEEVEPTPLERGESPPPPTPDQIAAAPVIGENAEERLEAAQAAPAPAPEPPATTIPPLPEAPVKETPPPADGLNVKGVSKERLRFALQIAQFDPEMLRAALATYDGVKRGLVYLFRPPQFRDKLREYHEAESAKMRAELEQLNERLIEADAAATQALEGPDVSAILGELEQERAKVQTLEGEVAKLKEKAAKKPARKKAATKGKSVKKPDQNRQVSNPPAERSAGTGSGSAARDAAANRKPPTEEKK